MATHWQLMSRLNRVAHKHGVVSEEFRQAEEALKTFEAEDAKRRAWEWACGVRR
jgi:hypothetical protein